MFQGTGSDVGKSIVTAAVCRILKQDGHHPVPFKAQNMALNSFVTKEGGEMGRAQVVQAEAAGVEPLVAMNPILLKPTGNSSSQVIVMGKAVATMKASEYHEGFAAQAFPVVEKAIEKLSSMAEVLVVEGAGSPAEVNLKANDIVNMRVARYLQSPVILVTDIDRGGALASIVGTMELLDEEEKALVKGFIINKFRGDITLLRPALDFLREKTGVPVLGVLPYMDKMDIDDEDSVALRGKSSKGESDINIAVIRLPHISNFTDFEALVAEDGVSVYYVKYKEQLASPDLIILPGSKNTSEDLFFLKETGLGKEIIKKNKQETPVIGICGGYQMLGQEVRDPQHTESECDRLPALGLLPVVTTFLPDKVTRQVTARACANSFLDMDFSGEGLRGYEIHMGNTEYTDKIACAFTTDRGEGMVLEDGAVRSDGLVMGTYIHGIFDNDDFRHKLVDVLRRKKGVIANSSTINIAERKEAAYENLAATVRKNLDMEKLYQIIGLG